MAGRKTKLTPAVQEKLCSALRAGNTRRAACGYAGISEDSFANYLRKSSDFSEAIAQAEADVEVRMVAIILRAAGEGHYQAAEWWLERHPRTKREWRKTEEFDVRKLPTDQLVELAAECDRRIESPGDRLALAEASAEGEQRE